MKAYRHGEMVLIPVPEDLRDEWQSLYDQAGQKMTNPRVIAEGEVTGHKHELTEGKVNAATLNENTPSVRVRSTAGYLSRRTFLRNLGIGSVAGPVILLEIAKAATLRHPEHNALKVPAGKYVSFAQREYDEATARRVID